MDALALHSLALGFILGLLYALLRPLHYCRARAILSPIADLLFFFIAATLSVWLFSHFNGGRIRIYAAADIALGAMIFHAAVFAPLRAAARAIARIKNEPGATGAAKNAIKYIFK